MDNRPSPTGYLSLSLQPVDFRGHNEVALGKAVDLVRPHGNLGFAPRQQNVGMVPLFFGERSHAIHEFERLLEVGKSVGASEMVLVDYTPERNFAVHCLEFPALERRHSAAARNALFVS